jgi:SAM-dependent methyltransferase
MNQNISFLCEPETGEELVSVDGNLISQTGSSYPVVNGIPRFVDSNNYSSDFGFQWNTFSKTQLDSFSGTNISEGRLERCLRGNLTKIKDKKVLEAGSGAGRFTEILLKHGAIVHSFDFSNAVEANAKNNGENNNLILVQADIRKIPFPKSSYDFVVCLGVLQHTPNPEDSIKHLWDMVKPGGALVIDHYPWKWRIILPPPIGEALALYRQINLRLPKKFRFKFVKKLVDFWFPVHWKLRDSSIIQRILRRFSPVLFYYPHLKLRDRQMYYDWALLDTHDGTTDFYKHRRTVSEINFFLKAIGATDILVNSGGNGVEAFCRKPLQNK